MKMIWRYPLAHGYPIIVPMPVGAQILSIQAQYDIPTIWALVEPGHVLCDRFFYALNTGEEFDDTGLKFIATVQLYDGKIVKHIYERQDDGAMGTN